MLLANLLSFYEQQLLFTDQEAALRPYNLEKPLWVFVGSSVNAIHTENREKHSDILTVVSFLHRLLANHGGWVTETIGQLLEGRSGLTDPDGADIFASKFPYLRQQHRDPAGMYHDILARVLHTTSSGGLTCAPYEGKTANWDSKPVGPRLLRAHLYRRYQ